MSVSTPFSFALKAAVSKINSIVSDMDEKVDTFAEQVLELFVDYEENLFKNDEDKADIKQKIVGLFEMFQPEKRASSVSGYNIFCKEQREAVKAKNPELSASAILGALGAEWKALDKDEKEGVKWLLKAAEKQNMNAEYILAKCYYFGLGVTCNKFEAIKWCQIAVDHDQPQATALLRELISNY
jgi:hypothetical protein